MSKVSPKVIQKLKEQQAAISAGKKQIVKVDGVSRKLRRGKKAAAPRIVKKRRVLVKAVGKAPALEQVKGYVTEMIAELFMKLAGASEEQQVEQGFREFAARVEAAMSADGSRYYDHLARLAIFLSVSDPIGRYAQLFQTKAAQGVYGPERLLEMELSEMLPEVFLNRNNSDAVQAEILSQIEGAILAKKTALQRSIPREIEYQKDPTKKRRFFAESHVAVSIDKSQTLPAKDICHNPSWDIKAVNIIICKEAGKFYCLNVEKVIQELGTAGTATNYLTGKSLHEDVKASIQKRYAQEIAQVKATGGAQVPVGVWTVADEQHLEKTEKVLKELENNMEIDDHVKNNLPGQLVETFEKATNPQKKELVQENLKSVRETLAVVSGKEQLVAKAVTAKRSKEERLENQVISEQILKSGSISGKLFRQFLARLHSLRDNLTEELPQLVKKLSDREQELERAKNQKAPVDAIEAEIKPLVQRLRVKRDKLVPISRLIEQLEAEMKTFEGVILRLREEATLKSDLVKGITEALGMNMIIPNDLLLAQEEKKNLEKYVHDIEKEIAYVESVKKSIA